MRAFKNTAFRSGFSALLLRTDESARVYAPAERCYSITLRKYVQSLFFTGPGGCSQHHGCPWGSPHFQNPLPPTRCDKVPEVLVQRQPICVESTLAACATLQLSINFLPEVPVEIRIGLQTKKRLTVVLTVVKVI